MLCCLGAKLDVHVSMVAATSWAGLRWTALWACLCSVVECCC